MSGVAARTRSPATNALREIQAPVSDGLERVVVEMQRIVTDDLPLIREVSGHLLQMRGKMFRPTLALLCSSAADRSEPRVITLAAVVELMHLATLVHDDSVDHSVLRRGSADGELAVQPPGVGDHGRFSLLPRAHGARADERPRDHAHRDGRRQRAHDRRNAPVEPRSTRSGSREEDYCHLIRAKTASLISGACESGALCGAPDFRQPLAEFGDRLGMAFQIADDILDYTGNESVTGKAGRARSARAQSDPAADRGVAPRFSGSARAGSTICSPPRTPRTTRLPRSSGSCRRQGVLNTPAGAASSSHMTRSRRCASFLSLLSGRR